MPTPCVTTRAAPRKRLLFSVEVCGACPLRAQCVKGEGARSITLSVHEARMAKARADELKPSVKAKLHRRPVVERKIDHLQDLGLRKARYRGRRKTLLQALLAATVANFGRLHLLGALGTQQAAIAA